jgi:hypothetical protein
MEKVKKYITNKAVEDNTLNVQILTAKLRIEEIEFKLRNGIISEFEDLMRQYRAANIRLQALKQRQADKGKSIGVYDPTLRVIPNKNNNRYAN